MRTVTRSGRVLFVVSVIGALLVVAPPGSTATDPLAALSTPQRLELAVATGELDRGTANLYLAYALSSQHRRVPAAYQGTAPWHGTVPLLNLRRALAAGSAGRFASTIDGVLNPPRTEDASNNCSGTTGGVNQVQSTNFVIDYGTISGGLTIASYQTSLDTSWATEVTSFGWAAPPLHPSAPGGKYHVVIANLGSGLYGFVSEVGTFAGVAGNNPNTAWNDVDARRSCMALNRDYSGFPGTSQQALDATTAHEFNHSIQYGYGALHGATAADDVFVEGGATWMEDEVFDSSNDNHNYLWPDFDTSMGNYTLSPYPYWVVFRAITERFGAGVAGGGEDVMQRFWEQTSQGASENLAAMSAGVSPEGVTLGDAYHAGAVAMKFNKGCSGGYVLPYCLEEGAAYVAAAGATTVHGSIGAVGGSYVTNTSSTGLRDNYALNWVSLPGGASAYDVTLHNTDTMDTGGQLRGSVVCDTGSSLVVTPFPAVVGAGASTTITGFNPSGCASRVAVLTNQNQSAADPSSSDVRSYTLSTSGGGGGGGGDVTVTVADFSFTPKKPTAQRGDTVEWDFNGPSTHNATDSSGMGLFGSGNQGPGGSYTFTFEGAGSFAYQCTIHPSQMSGQIKVPMTVSPTSGGTGTVFTVTWANAVPAGYRFDVQIKRPGGNWVNWQVNQTVVSSTFTPDAGTGTYSFRARTENSANNKASKWSAVKSITVS